MLLAMGAVLLFQAASTTASPAHIPVVTNPDWRRRPTGEDIARVFPKAAEAQRREGRATMSCGVSEEGVLVGCAVIDEDPKGAEFGEAVLSVAHLFRMRPMTRDGVPVEGGTVRIPFSFRLPNMPTAEVALTLRDVGPGTVVLNCEATAERRFADCNVISSSSFGTPMDDYARAVAAKVEVPPGQAGRLNLRVVFGSK